jgi:hypothetical protein
MKPFTVLAHMSLRVVVNNRDNWRILNINTHVNSFIYTLCVARSTFSILPSKKCWISLVSCSQFIFIERKWCWLGVENLDTHNIFSTQWFHKDADDIFWDIVRCRQQCHKRWRRDGWKKGKTNNTIFQYHLFNYHFGAMTSLGSVSGKGRCAL